MPGQQRGGRTFQLRLGEVLPHPLPAEPAHGVRQRAVGLGDQPGGQEGTGPVEREDRQHPRRLHGIRLRHLTEAAERCGQVAGEVVEHGEVVLGLGLEAAEPVRARQVEARLEVGAGGRGVRGDGAA